MEKCRKKIVWLVWCLLLCMISPIWGEEPWRPETATVVGRALAVMPPSNEENELASLAAGNVGASVAPVWAESRIVGSSATQSYQGIGMASAISGRNEYAFDLSRSIPIITTPQIFSKSTFNVYSINTIPKTASPDITKNNYIIPKVTSPELNLSNYYKVPQTLTMPSIKMEYIPKRTYVIPQNFQKNLEYTSYAAKFVNTFYDGPKFTRLTNVLGSTNNVISTGQNLVNLKTRDPIYVAKLVGNALNFTPMPIPIGIYAEIGGAVRTAVIENRNLTDITREFGPGLNQYGNFRQELIRPTWLNTQHKLGASVYSTYNDGFTNIQRSVDFTITRTETFREFTHFTNPIEVTKSTNRYEVIKITQGGWNTNNYGTSSYRQGNFAAPKFNTNFNNNWNTNNFNLPKTNYNMPNMKMQTPSMPNIRTK